MPHVCRICGNKKNNIRFIAREMMFGFREEFYYFKCSNCGCLQITDIPQNLDKYYPNEYYQSQQKVMQVKTNKIKKYFKAIRLNYSLGQKTIIGYVLNKLYGKLYLYSWLELVELKASTKILEIGSATGLLLSSLRSAGFTNCTGVDLYIDKDIDLGDGVMVYKRDYSTINEKYQFIMLHHCFEHFLDPVAAFTKLSEITLDGGYVLLRVPIVTSFAWNKYQTNWVQLDAPRHLYLHSLDSIKYLADISGFKVVIVSYDSTEFQFWGSEQYTRNIAMYDKESYKYGIEKSIFSQNDIDNFKKKATELNQSCDGDQVCVVLRKAPVSS